MYFINYEYYEWIHYKLKKSNICSRCKLKIINWMQNKTKQNKAKQNKTKPLLVFLIDGVDRVTLNIHPLSAPIYFCFNFKILIKKNDFCVLFWSVSNAFEIINTDSIIIFKPGLGSLTPWTCSLYLKKKIKITMSLVRSLNF